MTNEDDEELPREPLSAQMVLDRLASTRDNTNNYDAVPTRDEENENAHRSNGSLLRDSLRSLWVKHETGILLFLAGVWNNAPYVIMLAAAKEVSEGGVALVYIANILPGLLIKASGPYWFDRVSYATRLYTAAFFMGLAFASVAFFSAQTADWRTLGGQLFGIAFISAQCALGEASILALAGGKLGDEALTWFASGTGLAGPVGFLYHVSCTDLMGWSLATTCTLGVFVWACGYAIITQQCLQSGSYDSGSLSSPSIDDQVPLENRDGIQIQTLMLSQSSSTSGNVLDQASSEPVVSHHDSVYSVVHLPRMTIRARMSLSCSLWPYMIPLFVVYAAEYACQGGAWTAMGFPVDSASARARFYERSNWIYQMGVLISRSSGTLFTINQVVLWILPGLQVLNLVFFTWTAQLSAPPFWYNPTVLYGAALWTGLLGGAVYVHGYRRVIADVPQVHREFALATVSLAESVGVLMADIFGLFLQSCLYDAKHIPGAVVKCPS
jgi:battenin